MMTLYAVLIVVGSLMFIVTAFWAVRVWRIVRQFRGG